MKTFNGETSRIFGYKNQSTKYLSAQAGKIKPEYPDTFFSQRFADMSDSLQVFTAGKTVCKQYCGSALTGFGLIHSC